MAVLTKCQSGKSYVVKERPFTYFGNGIGNFHAHQIGASFKGGQTDALEILGKLDLAKSRLSLESELANRRNYFSVNIVGDGNISAVTRVRTDLNGAVIQFNVGIRNTVLLVDPISIQSQIAVELILIPHVFLGTLRIVVPAIEDGIETLGLGHILQGMGADEHLLGVVQLVGHHVEGDGSPLLQHQGTDVQGAVAVVEIGAEVA